MLENLESAINYREWLAAQSFSILGQRPFELGSGVGTYAEYIIEVNDTDQYIVSEVDAKCLDILQKKFSKNEKIKVVDLNDLSNIGSKNCTSFVSWNVLEHIQEDVNALKIIYEVCQPGANVMIFVPAFQHLYSSFDAKLNHIKRYDKKLLTSLAKEAGLVDIQVRYFNLLGYFYWLIFIKLLRLTPKDGRFLRFLDATIIPCLRFLERKINVPFGQSVIMLAKVPK